MSESVEEFDCIQIQQAAKGCVSGTLREWPALFAALNRRGLVLSVHTPALELKAICQGLVEINRLRAENERLEKEMKTVAFASGRPDISALVSRNKTLRDNAKLLEASMQVAYDKVSERLTVAVEALEEYAGLERLADAVNNSLPNLTTARDALARIREMGGK